MTGGSSVLRRAYEAMALFAMLNLVGTIALVGLLLAGGALDGEKLRQIVAVLRGGQPSPTALAPVAGQAVAASPDVPARSVGAGAAAESQMDLEIVRRESERIKTELEQRLALNNSILLRVTTERENFQKEREQAAHTEESTLRERRKEGFKKQIDIYESLAPKVAVEHLLAMPEPDDAAKVLLEMNTRKAKAIVEAAKRGDQIEKMKVILARVREVAPERSADLESKEQ